MMSKIPTERKILRCIYNMYKASFPADETGIGKVFVAIDIEAVAKKLCCDKHILFGYLYYHLDHKYRYSSGDKSNVQLFALKAGDLRHAINLPYLAAILAGQNQEQSKFNWSLGFSIAAMALSALSIIAHWVKK